MPFQIFIPAEVSCDNPECDAVCSLAWAVDPRELAKQRKPFTQKQASGIAACLTKAAVDEGWLIDRAGSYCPKCKLAVKAGEIRPSHGAISAAGLIDELRFVAQARKGDSDGF